MIENIENKAATLKHEVQDMMKTNKEKLDNVRVEAGANSILLVQLLKTVLDIVERLDIWEEFQTNTKEPMSERDIRNVMITRRLLKQKVRTRKI